MKCLGRDRRGSWIESLPVWEEWIEILCYDAGHLEGQSLPVWEEWIEMRRLPVRRRRSSCLFPYGKSGLKFKNFLIILHKCRSLPVWEEWIEIPGG